MIHIQGTIDRDRIVKRCHKCHKNIKFGKHYIMSYKLVPVHFPNCEQPKTGFGIDGMGRSYTIIDGIDTPHRRGDLI